MTCKQVDLNKNSSTVHEVPLAFFFYLLTVWAVFYMIPLVATLEDLFVTVAYFTTLRSFVGHKL